MTVSITYGHGVFHDCDNTADWAGATYNNMVAGDTETTVENGDVLRMKAVFDGADDEWWRLRYDCSNVSCDTYPYYAIRWKTSAASDGAGIKVRVVFDDASFETILGPPPQFSTTWKVTTGTLTTTGKNIDKIQIYADDYPDTLAAGTFYVYVDFVLLHKGTFSFPYTTDVALTLENRYADIQIPGRVGDVTQYMGAASPSIRLSGDINIGTSSAWGVPPLEYLYRVWQEAHTEPWNWFSTGGLTDTDRMINCKVTLRRFPMVEGDGSTRKWSLDLKHYSLSSGSEGIHNDLQWLGI